MRPVRITNKALKDCSARIRIKGARFLQIIRDVIYVMNIVIYHQVSVYHLENFTTNVPNRTENSCLKSSSEQDIFQKLTLGAPVHLCSECSFVFFLNRLTMNERASISRTILEIEAYAMIYIQPKISNEAGFGHRQPRLARTRP